MYGCVSSDLKIHADVHAIIRCDQEALQPTIISHNATISACEKFGAWELALLLFKSIATSQVAWRRGGGLLRLPLVMG